MDSKMLSIRSFEKNQTLINLINNLIIYLKLQLHNVDANFDAAEIEKAKEIISNFLSSLNKAITEDSLGSKIVKGADIRERVFIRKFIDAKKKPKQYRSILFKKSPTDVIELLNSTAKENSLQLIDALSDLRNLLNEHLAIDLKDLVGDI